MTYTCRPFYSMQKILAHGTPEEFHRKFGELTKGTRGVYIWGFAKEFYQIQDDSETIDASMKQFEVQVSSENIGIYYVGKVESMNLNIFERIMQERANLFGGFFPIFEFKHYFVPTPFLTTWNQMRDLTNQKSTHQSRLKKYQSCTCTNSNPFSQPQTPLLYSNAYFNKNNLVDQLLNTNLNPNVVLKSVKEMSSNFIFTWIDCETKQKVSEDENLLHDVLGVNVLGVGGIRRIAAIKPSILTNNTINNTSASIDFSNNVQLFNRISKIHNDSIQLINQCRCFKG